MNDERRRLVNTLCGETESGKTYLFKHIADNYKHGPVTIFNYQNEPSLLEYPNIKDVLEVKYQRSGVYCHTSKDYKSFIHEIIKKFEDRETRGLVILDDCTSYIPQNEWKPITDLMTSTRHMNLDLILVFHHLWRIPPYIMDGTQVLTIFRTGEPLDKGNIKRFRHGADIMEAHANVEVNSDKNYHERVTLHGVVSA